MTSIACDNHLRAWNGNHCRHCEQDMDPPPDRLPELHDDMPRPKYLGAYRVWLQYGGPEEGGWWATMYQHMASVLVRKDDDLGALARELWEEYRQEDDGRRISDSNASCAIFIQHEDTPAACQQLSVGHYE